MNATVAPRRARPASRCRWLAALVAALALSGAACSSDDDSETSDTADTEAGADAPIEFRSEAGPHVDAPDRAMAMMVDAVESADGDILIRLRVENRDDGYLDLGVEGTIYGPLVVMRDDRDNLYESLAVEPAGVPGRRLADLSLRLTGPLDPDATSFTLELATQRGPLTSPTAPLPTRDGIRWRVDDPSVGSADPTYAAAPRLPDLVHFWLETVPLPADR